MRIEGFIQKVQGLPIIDTGVLLAGQKNSTAVKVQISRWAKSGKLLQLKRGIYALAPAYRKIQPVEYYIASVLKHPSYVSLEKALEFHGLIPEAVHVYTSLTTKRPTRFTTPLGIFDYRHIQVSLFWGYRPLTIDRQTFFMANPEKAILDLIYLNDIRVSLEYLNELRLQNYEQIDLGRLEQYALRFQ